MAVTIKDIAEIAKVSHTTVSRALRGHPRISSETIERIQTIADELGYVPNTVARGLKTSRSRVLGVIVRRIDDPFFSQVLQGIEDVLHDAGYSLFVSASQRNPGREREIIQTMGERRVDGVIISSTQVQSEHIRQLDQFNVPMVLINNQAIDMPDIHSVYHDDVFGGQQLAHHLIALGHQHIAFLGNERGGKTNAERLQGYQEAMSQAGLNIHDGDIVVASNGLPDGGAEGMKKILALFPRPTAVFCYNDLVAIGATQAAQQSGYRVPEDISITGFDDIELAAYMSPSLTTFHQPKYELGYEAAQMMLSVLEDVEMGGTELGKTAVSHPPKVIMLRGELIQRRSTAAHDQE